MNELAFLKLGRPCSCIEFEVSSLTDYVSKLLPPKIKKNYVSKLVGYYYPILEIVGMSNGYISSWAILIS
jgi:hypothetical protein